jgi:hypothetical protein
MSADLSASAYLVDGTDLAASGVTLTHDGSGLWSGLTEDVGTEIYTGTDGGLILGGSYRPFQHSTMYDVSGTSFSDVWSKIRAFRRRCKPGRSVTLTRQMPDPDGTDANVSMTATARRLTDRISWIGESAAVVDVDWMIVDGVWHGASTTISSAAGTQSILGDTRTRRMTVTLPTGAARTVTNTTNGYAFTFSTGTPSGGTIVDVEARTATNITSGVDVSQYLSWTKAAPMQLEPGSNVFTVSAGTASISYQPAYL